LYRNDKSPAYPGHRPGRPHQRAAYERGGPVLAGVRVDRARPAVHLGNVQSRGEQAQKPVRERDSVRPLASRAAVARWRPGDELRQRQLHGRIPQTQRLHRHTGPLVNYCPR